MRTCEQGFHTAAQATVALPPSWFHHIVPPLARDALAAVEGFLADDHAAADDSDTDNHKHSFNHDYCGTNDDGDISRACFQRNNGFR